MSSDTKTFEGQCFCGAVTIEVTGDPVGAGYCHCANCRSWSAGPVNAFTLWKPEAVKVTQGEDQIGEYHNNERSYRQWCKVCGGHLLTRHPTWGLVDVFAATIPAYPFTPEVHVNYASTVLPMKDGLPKDTDSEALATYVLAVMEGGVMLSRSYGSVEPFDRVVKQLREHFRLLLTPRPKGAK